MSHMFGNQRQQTNRFYPDMPHCLYVLQCIIWKKQLVSVHVTKLVFADLLMRQLLTGCAQPGRFLSKTCHSPALCCSLDVHVAVVCIHVLFSSPNSNVFVLLCRAKLFALEDVAPARHNICDRLTEVNIIRSHSAHEHVSKSRTRLKALPLHAASGLQIEVSPNRAPYKWFSSLVAFFYGQRSPNFRTSPFSSFARLGSFLPGHGTAMAAGVAGSLNATLRKPSLPMELESV